MKFSDIIVCDDIRREIGNKRTLVGVYSNQLIFYTDPEQPNWPTPKQLGIYFNIILEDGDPAGLDGFKGSVSVKPSSNKKTEEVKIADFQGGLSSNMGKIVTIDLLSPLLIPFPGTLILSFEVQREGKKISSFRKEIIEISEAPSNQPAKV